MANTITGFRIVIPSGIEENSRGYIELFDTTAYYCS